MTIGPILGFVFCGNGFIPIVFADGIELEPIRMTTNRPTITRGSRGYLLSTAFLLAFVVLVEMYFGWGTLLAPWRELGIDAVTGILVLMAVTYLARGMRLYRFYETRLGFLPSLKLLLQHNLWTVLLPARSGEAAFPVLMHRYFDVPPRQSIPVLLWFRMLDLHSLVLVVGVAWLWRHGAFYALLFACGWIALLPGAFYSRPLLVALLNRCPGNLAAKCRTLVEEAPLSVNKLAESWAWTAICWSTKLLLFSWIISVFTSLNFLPSLLGALGGEVSSALPIHSIGGFGTYHAGVASALVPFDVSLADAIRSGVNLHLVVLGGAILSGMLAYAVPRRLLAAGNRLT